MNTQDNRQKQQKQVMIQQVYSAPLPPPQILAEYEKIHNGTAKIIVEAFAKQIDHRIEIEKNIVSSRTKQSNRGQIFAFIISVLLVVLAFFALKHGYPKIATIICSATLVSVIYAFVANKKSNNQSK